MINTSRIVPITVTDLLTNFAATVALVQDLNGTSLSVLEASAIGEFTVAAAGTYLAAEPVKEVSFGEGVSTGTVYFVAAYDYVGFKGVTNSGTVAKDGRTLYKGVLSSGTVTITKIG